MELAQKLLAELFPSRCLLCHKTVSTKVENPNIEICAPCLQALPDNTPCCSRCALPLAEEVIGEVMCGRCIKKLPKYDYLHSPFKYQDEIIGLIHQLKFADKISYARTIGELLLLQYAEKIKHQHGKPDWIIPVPLHTKRLKQRGYNQSTEIARVLSKNESILIAHDAVERVKATQEQKGLSARQRQSNIKGVFKVIETAQCKHILILDDVVTTGATVNELATVLKKSGVEKVGVLSIARAPLKT